MGEPVERAIGRPGRRRFPEEFGRSCSRARGGRACGDLRVTYTHISCRVLARRSLRRRKQAAPSLSPSLNYRPAQATWATQAARLAKRRGAKSSRKRACELPLETRGGGGGGAVVGRDNQSILNARPAFRRRRRRECSRRSCKLRVATGATFAPRSPCQMSSSNPFGRSHRARPEADGFRTPRPLGRWIFAQVAQLNEQLRVPPTSSRAPVAQAACTLCAVMRQWGAWDTRFLPHELAA